MATSVKLIFDRKNKASATTPGTIEIEVYQDGKRKRYSTGIRVKKGQWKDGRVRNHPSAIELNAKLEKCYNDYLKLANSPGFNIESLTNKPTKQSTPFLDWMKSEIDGRKDLRPNTIKQHKSTLHLLQKWNKINSFNDLNTKNIVILDEYLKSGLKKQSSVHGHHKTLKVYINRAIIQGLLDASPYDGIKIPRGKTETIKYILEEQRNIIENLELSGTMELVRDMFLFACYTGLAYADMTRVTREDIITENGRMFLVDKRQKSGTPYKLMLLPEAKAILEKYDWNLDRISNQKANVYLKAIGTIANIKVPLTMHMGRHTFATWALSKGVPIEVVSKMLAHSDIATTQIYAKVLQKEVDRGFELLSKKG